MRLGSAGEKPAPVSARNTARWIHGGPVALLPEADMVPSFLSTVLLSLGAAQATGLPAVTPSEPSDDGVLLRLGDVAASNPADCSVDQLLTAFSLEGSAAAGSGSLSPPVPQGVLPPVLETAKPPAPPDPARAADKPAAPAANPQPFPQGLLPVATYAGGSAEPAAGVGPGETPAPEPKVEKEPRRRALPSPWESPPFPSSEYQGYPLIGVPVDTTEWPLMKALQGTWEGDVLNSQRIRVYGWINAAGNVSTSSHSNLPDSYWIVPNRFELDQFVLRAERLPDTVQTDHIDWGFRSTFFYGTDYRFMVAGGWWPGDTQLLKHNFLYGVDFTEQYFDLYIPWVAQGMVVRVGRWIACPDIETQFAPDNYLGTHSILFTFDTYTQTGVMATVMLNKQWTVQACINAGDDMAPWYQGAIPCGMFGVRWVSEDNNDSIYLVLNQINNAKFRRFQLDGQPAGHDNFNYPVITWQHRINPRIHTKIEAYFMWERDAVLGGTVSIGPAKPFGGGGGIGADIPGTSLMYGVVNYTMFQTSKRGFLTIRNEWWKDQDGERTGFPGTYSSHTIGFTHNFTPEFQVRPEIGYYRNWTNPAFDLGTKKGMVLAGFDVTLRF
jgi:hypothetical protein